MLQGNGDILEGLSRFVTYVDQIIMDGYGGGREYPVIVRHRQTDRAPCLFQG